MYWIIKAGNTYLASVVADDNGCLQITAARSSAYVYPGALGEDARMDAKHFRKVYGLAFRATKVTRKPKHSKHRWGIWCDFAGDWCIGNDEKPLLFKSSAAAKAALTEWGNPPTYRVTPYPIFTTPKEPKQRWGIWCDYGHGWGATWCDIEPGKLALFKNKAAAEDALSKWGNPPTYTVRPYNPNGPTDTNLLYGKP